LIAGHPGGTGLLVGAEVHRADIQDRGGAPDVFKTMAKALPWLRRVIADCGYPGGKLESALKQVGTWTLAIIRRSNQAKGSVVLPRRRRRSSHDSKCAHER
jgi:transposase